MSGPRFDDDLNYWVDNPDERVCSYCGHEPHDGARCVGRSDEGRYPCACSFPEAGNYTEDSDE